MLGVAGGPHHVLLLLLVVPSLEPAPRTLPICHLANLPFVVCLASNKHSHTAPTSDDFPLQLRASRDGSAKIVVEHRDLSKIRRRPQSPSLGIPRTGQKMTVNTSPPNIQHLRALTEA